MRVLLLWCQGTGVMPSPGVVLLILSLQNETGSPAESLDPVRLGPPPPPPPPGHCFWSRGLQAHGWLLQGRRLSSSSSTTTDPVAAAAAAAAAFISPGAASFPDPAMQTIRFLADP